MPRARRAPRMPRPESVRAIPSLSRFLTQPAREPGDARNARQPADIDAVAPNAAGRDAGDVSTVDLSTGDLSTGDPSAGDPNAADLNPGDLNLGDQGPADGDPLVWAPADRAAAPRQEVPTSSAVELRDLAELADLLTELAGLVHDLGVLIVSLMTAATGAGDGRVRTFRIPPELAELAVAHQELKAEQQALNARFEAVEGHRERAALRDSLAELTERATRAVSAAAAAVTPREDNTVAAVVPRQDNTVAAAPRQNHMSDGQSEAATQPEGSGAQLKEPSREETGVQSTTGGTPPQGPVRWRDASVPDRRLAPVAVALDAPDIDVAAHWATLVTPHVSTVKIGLELYLRYGPAVVATVRGGSGVHVFLDLKLHDIPNTVAAAARAVSKLRPEILTVHAAGGTDMIKAAVESAPDTIVAGVTLLTSIGQKDLVELGMEGSVSDAVRRMATLAVSAGARGLVCSPQEVAAVRAEVGQDIVLITPGLRPAGAPSDDQARVATPVEALKAGADLLVIGRPITKAPDPGAAAAAIAASLRRAVPAT
jgi:orotidine-5'-phosphate decarboxylase